MIRTHDVGLARDEQVHHGSLTPGVESFRTEIVTGTEMLRNHGCIALIDQLFLKGRLTNAVEFLYVEIISERNIYYPALLDA